MHSFKTLVVKLLVVSQAFYTPFIVVHSANADESPLAVNMQNRMVRESAEKFRAEIDRLRAMPGAGAIQEDWMAKWEATEEAYFAERERIMEEGGPRAANIAKADAEFEDARETTLAFMADRADYSQDDIIAEMEASLEIQDVASEMSAGEGTIFFWATRTYHNNHHAAHPVGYRYPIYFVTGLFDVAVIAAVGIFFLAVLVLAAYGCSEDPYGCD